MIVHCVTCGGRGGWDLSDGRVYLCRRCLGTGEEQQGPVRSLLVDDAIPPTGLKP